MTTLDSLFKGRYITLPKKSPSSQNCSFSSSQVWMWELDDKASWMLKNWCFWTVVLEKTLESPWDCKESNQSILKEISPECSLEELVLKLKLQYFGHLMRITDSFEKTLILGKTEGCKRRGQQRTRWLNGITGHEFGQAPGVGDGHGGLACCSPWGCKGSQLSDWTELIKDERELQILVYLNPNLIFSQCEGIRHSKNVWTFVLTLEPFVMSFVKIIYEKLLSFPCLHGLMLPP